MDNDETKRIYSKIFKNISIWASQTYKRSLIMVFFLLVLGVPLIVYLQSLVTNFKYIVVSLAIFSFLQKTFNLSNYLIGIGFLIVGIILYKIFRMINNTRVIKDNFGNGLNGWAVPLDASWTTQRCIDKLGKMLSVTNSDYPGILKEAYWWYDYEISFETKIEKTHRSQNFTVVIRSESNFDGVMLQITRTHLRPHFIYNGTFIRDAEAEEQLPTILPLDEWIKVKLIVKGKDVDMYIDGYKLQYKIPTKVFEVTNDILSRGSVTIDDLEDNQKELTTIKDILSMPESPAKVVAMQTISATSIPPYSKIILEYQKGSVGFREAGREKAHFRDFEIKRI